MITANANRSIGTFLTSPCKVAQKLEWRKNSGSLLSLSISVNRLNVVICSHPEVDESPRILPPIDLKTTSVANRKVISPSVSEELSDVVKNHGVCGMVVSWPVQKEGWCGASCGRVLNVLDQIASSGLVLSVSRPVCLYDIHHYVPTSDTWGRNPVYGNLESAYQKRLHVASEEQYQDSGANAVDVSNDFLRTYFQSKAPTKETSSFCTEVQEKCFGRMNFA